MPPVLEVRVSAGYKQRTVIDNLAFALQPGERFGLLGTSGAGKSTLLLALLGLLPWRGGWATGEVVLAGRNLLALRESEIRALRGKAIALVPQSPVSALNPALTLRKHFEEAWRAHEKASKARFTARMEGLLRRVELPVDTQFLNRRPGQISVGQAQRCMIALALLHRPSVLIADEATSALDPATGSEILQLLREISEREGMALLFVSHDLLSVLRLCERYALLHAGRLAETLHVAQTARAQHPVLRRLLQSLPVPPEVLLRYAASGPALQLPERLPAAREVYPDKALL